MNNLQGIIERIDAQFKLIDPKKVKEIEKALTMSPIELCSFQELKSLAQINGIIDMDTALFIYNALGNWDKQTVGTKFVLQKLHSELLQEKIKGTL